jgi:phosphopantetheinyl transferase (holo-ACP synthase)
VDVVSVSRLARVSVGLRRLMHQVCADEERPDEADAERAARLWTGKEAIAKSIGSGFWQHGVGWPDVRILPDGTVRLVGGAARVAGDCTIDLTFSRAGDRMFAVAFRRAPG